MPVEDEDFGAIAKPHDLAQVMGLFAAQHNFLRRSKRHIKMTP